jgi:pyridoxamine 5'-phosphate oxidase
MKLVTVSDRDQVASMRRRYGRGGLSESDLDGTWWQQFGRWFADAVESGLLVEPNAMVVATADPTGAPSARTVLLRDFDERGFVFYTHYQSRKGRELAANPRVGLVFPWVPLERQVVVRGVAGRVSRAETAAYFATRPYGSQLGAWASPQSSVIPSREPLEQAVAELAARWPEGGEVPAPEHWGGFRVAPETVEFWQGRPDRLHDRLHYRRDQGGAWVVERLAP